LAYFLVRRALEKAQEEVKEGPIFQKEEPMSGGAMRNVQPTKAMRQMLNKMAYLALDYAIKGKRKQAEVMRRMARQVHREYDRTLSGLEGRSSC
jgi:hypothetical protein